MIHVFTAQLLANLPVFINFSPLFSCVVFEKRSSCEQIRWSSLAIWSLERFACIEILVIVLGGLNRINTNLGFPAVCIPCLVCCIFKLWSNVFFLLCYSYCTIWCSCSFVLYSWLQTASFTCICAVSCKRKLGNFHTSPMLVDESSCWCQWKIGIDWDSTRCLSCNYPSLANVTVLVASSYVAFSSC